MYMYMYMYMVNFKEGFSYKGFYLQMWRDWKSPKKNWEHVYVMMCMYMYMCHCVFATPHSSQELEIKHQSELLLVMLLVMLHDERELGDVSQQLQC